MTISMRDLMAQIVRYRIDEETDDLIYIPSGDKIHIGTSNLLYMLLYIIVKNWGNQPYYILEASEDIDADMDAQSGDDLSNLSVIINPDSIMEMESELKEYGIYMGDTPNILHDFRATLVILNVSELETVDALCLAIKSRLALTIPASIVETVESISPEFIYIEDIQDYKQYRELSARLSKFGCASILLYVDTVSYSEQIEQIKHAELVENFISRLGEQKFVTFTENSDWVKSIFDRLGTPTFATVKAAYQYIIGLEDDLFIIDSFTIPDPAIAVLALAFCTHRKRSVFKYAYANFAYNEMCRKFFSFDFTYIDIAINYLRMQYIPGTFSIYLDGHTSSLIHCNDLKLNIQYKLADADSLLSFIKPVANDEVYLAIESDVRDTPVEILTNRQIDIEETFEQYGEYYNRYEFVNIIDYIKSLYPDMSMKARENYIYELLRLMEQLLYSYSKIYTIRDILIAHDLIQDKFYIGLATMSPKVECDIVQLGTICGVIQNKVVEPRYLNVESVFDFGNIVPAIKQAYQDSGLALTSFVATNYYIEDQRLIDMAIYNTVTSVNQESTQYSRIKDSQADGIDFRTVDTRNLTLAREFLPFAMQYIQSYGMRILRPYQAPLTIYGGVNEEYAETSTGRVNLYVDAMKHLPLKKGG